LEGDKGGDILNRGEKTLKKGAENSSVSTINRSPGKRERGGSMRGEAIDQI